VNSAAASIAAPKTSSIRPTTDRTRESLFNILSHTYPEALDGVRVLDLFAGTGALGSRRCHADAAPVLFVESGVEGRGVIQKTSRRWVCRAGRGCSAAMPPNLVPRALRGPLRWCSLIRPTARELGEKALASAARGGWLEDGALIILEEDSCAEPDPEMRSRFSKAVHSATQ
jgi:16S rRNA (guanine966-N2)-methyltransferase